MARFSDNLKRKRQDRQASPTTISEMAGEFKFVETLLEADQTVIPQKPRMRGMAERCTTP